MYHLRDRNKLCVSNVFNAFTNHSWNYLKLISSLIHFKLIEQMLTIQRQIKTK